MNGKKRYIPIVALGALLLSLLAILPVAAAGEVSFIVPGDINDNNNGALTDDTPDEQEWARQGGQLGILIDDSDLNSTVKRVLIPGIDTVDVGQARVNRNSNVVTIPNAQVIDLDSGTTGVQTVGRNDLIMIGRETLRKATKVEWVDNNPAATPNDATDDDVQITLDRPYRSNFYGSSEDIHRVKKTYVESTSDAYNAFDGDGYKSLASGLKFTDGAVGRTYPGLVNSDYTDVELDRDIVDSGIGSHIDTDPPASETHTSVYITPDDKGLSRRLKSAPSRGVRNDDVLVLQYVASVPDDPSTPNDNEFRAATIGAETYPPVGVDGGGSFRVTGDRSGSGHDNAYVLFWSSEENDTGSSVTVRSQAHQTPVTLVLNETTATSGEFAAKIALIPSQLSVSWDDIPADNSPATPRVTYTSGDVVKLENGSGANAAYLGYKVKYPTANRPGTVNDDTPLQNVETVADFNDNDLLVPRLPVNLRDTVSVRHPDDTGTIRVETTPAVFSRLSPAHDSASRDSRPELSAQVVDGDSGLKDSDIDFIYTVDNGPVLTLDPSEDGYTDDAPNGFTVRARVTRVDDDQDQVIRWWVKAKDKAGNISYSDRLPTVDGRNDKCVATTDDEAVASARCQPRIITVDNTDPNMLRAETGRFWDTSLSTGDSDDKTEYRASKASNTSILVIFSEHLDIGSVQASDFEVNDAPPQSADVFNVTVRDDNFDTYAESPNNAPDGSTADDDDPDTGDGNKAIVGDSVQDEGAKRGYVFLTVNAMTSNAKPKVELINNVEDIAGNRRSSTAISAATDRIGPELTVTFSGGDRPVTNGKVEFTVTSDEDIGSPTIRYARIRSTSSPFVEGGDSFQLLDTARTDAVVNFRSAKEYGVEITPPTDGLYTVFVAADDSAGGNPGTIGDDETTTSGSFVTIDVDDDTTALLFERDKAIPKPDFDPARTGVNDKFETDDANGFVRIDYSAEAREYYDARDSDGNNGKVCNQQVDPPNCDPDSTSDDERTVWGDDLDTYERLTIVSATLDGADISGDLNANSDGNIFQYHLDGMAEGEYTLEIRVEDEAGNRNAAVHKGTIKIIERKPYKLELNPGWNLVSLPGQPADTDINAVIPADHPIDAVATYDPMTPGTWLTSLESGDGTFDGTVETIQAGLAYWIRTTSFQALEVNIPKPTPGATTTLLPTIPISQGWNLIPVLDVDGDFEPEWRFGYFSGLTEGSIAAIYTYDTVTNSWASVSETRVRLGKGYWVYATKPGVIVP